MDGDAILQRMLATYASCRSYRDIGEVHEVLTSGDEPPQVWKLRKPFQTGFVRPLSFVFECFVDALSERADRKPYVVWSNERGARSWPNRGRAAVAVHTHASLEEPLALVQPPGLRFGRPRQRGPIRRAIARSWPEENDLPAPPTIRTRTSDASSANESA